MRKVLLLILAITSLTFTSCDDKEDDIIKENLFTGTWKLSEYQEDRKDVCVGKVYITFEKDKYTKDKYLSCKYLQKETRNFTVINENEIKIVSPEDHRVKILKSKNNTYKILFGKTSTGLNIER